MKQAETEPKPVPKKNPAHTCTPKMTNQVNERQPRGVEERPKHITPRTTHRKTSQGRESQAQDAPRPSTQWKKKVRKTETCPQAHNVSQSKGTKAREAEDRPKAHKVEQPSKTEAKKGKRDRPKAHNIYHPNGKEPADKGTQPSRDSGKTRMRRQTATKPSPSTSQEATSAAAHRADTQRGRPY